MTKNVFDELNQFVNRLEENRLAYRIYKIRAQAILVEIFVPGEHWEVEFLMDGSVEVERYRSNGEIRDQTALVELWSGLDSPTKRRRPAHREQPRQKPADAQRRSGP